MKVHVQDKDRKGAGPVRPAAKPKSARDDICILRYDRSSANNFAQFTRDLEVVAGTEYGPLFSFHKTDKYPIFETPVLMTVAKQETIEVASATLIQDIPARTAALEAINVKYRAYSRAEVTDMNDVYKEVWRSEVKAQAEKNSKMLENKTRLYWLIRGQMSAESIDMVRAHLVLFCSDGHRRRL